MNKHNNKIIQKSFSFNNEKIKFDIPFTLLKNNKFNENEGFNIDSGRQPSTNNTNFNSFFRASSPDTSYTNTNSNNNINTSFLNKNMNINKAFYRQEKKINEHKNRRPFSAIKQRENINFYKKQSNTKF